MSCMDGWRALARESEVMLDASRRDAWEEVVLAERRCASIVALLRALGDVPLAAEELAEKQRIIRKMMAEDAEVRDRAQPWMRKLQLGLTAAGNERRLDASYGGG